MSVFLQPIYTQTVSGSSTSTITFNSIPQTFTDLKILISVRNNSGSARNGLNYTFNGDTATNYSNTILIGYDSSSVGSFRSSSQTASNESNMNGGGSTTNTFSNSEVYIPNYTGSNFKSIISDSTAENNSSSSYIIDMGAALWRSTSAISSISFTSGSGNFVANSTITIYGITKG